MLKEEENKCLNLQKDYATHQQRTRQMVSFGLFSFWPTSFVAVMLSLEYR
jgi:hypothetical protein